MSALFIIIASTIVICLFILVKAIFSAKPKRNLTLFLIGFAIAGISLLFIIPNFINCDCPVPCKDLFESEASNVAVCLADYFSIPSRTKTPVINDLVLNGYTLPEKRKAWRKSDNIKVSDLKVSISGEIDDIIISITTDKGQCREGNTYVYYLNRHESEWLSVSPQY